MITRVSVVATLVVAAGCSHPAPRPPRVTTGTLSGVIRTADTGAPVIGAVVTVAPTAAPAPAQAPAHAIEETSGETGVYFVNGLAPGAYHVTVSFDDRTIGDEQITIEPDRVTGLDLVVSPRGLGATHGPVKVAGGGPLWRYRPADADPHVATIEGTVSEQGEETRLGGAVITIATRAGQLVADAVSDDVGRYRIAPLPPGAYVVSAYYTLIGRAQVEVRRSDIEVAAGEVVVVPLALETSGS